MIAWLIDALTVGGLFAVGVAYLGLAVLAVLAKE